MCMHDICICVRAFIHTHLHMEWQIYMYKCKSAFGMALWNGVMNWHYGMEIINGPME